MDEEQGVLEWISSLGQNTGSRLLDVLEQLDRSRNAVAVGMWKTMEEQDPTAFARGLKSGFNREEIVRTKDFLGKRYPEWVKEHPYWAGMAGFAGDVVTDPLMVVGAAPFKIAAKGVGFLTPEKVKSGISALGQTDLARGLNIYTGESKEIKDMADIAKGRMRGATSRSIEDAKNLQSQIMHIVKNTGVSYDDAAKGITQSVESARALERGEEVLSVRDALAEMGEGGLRWHRLPDMKKLQSIADDQAGRYHQMYLQEKAAGVPISDIMRRADDLGVDGYVPHILSAEARRRKGAESFKNWFRDPSAHKSLLQRKMPGTVQGINQRQARQMVVTSLRNKLKKAPTEKQIAAELKKLIASGKLPQFLHTDPALLMGVRESRHAMGMEGQNYLTQVASRFGIKDKDYLGKVRAGELPDDWARAVGIKNHYLPPQIAKLVNQQSKMLTDPSTTNTFLRHFDTVQGLWKSWSLAVRPAYHVRNLVGNVWNAFSLQGVKTPEPYRQAMAIQNQAWRGRLSKEKVIAGRSYDDIYQSARDHGVLGRGQYGADITRTMEETLERATGTRAGRASLPSRALGTRSLPIRAGFRFGNAVEDNARLAVYINSLKKGKTPLQASNDVKKSMFDYSDLSMFEKNVMKRLIPFYTWSRKNIPAQIEGILKNPQRYQAINTGRAQFEHEDGRPDPKETDWWGKRVPIYLGKQGEGDIWNLITLLNWAPVADLERLGSPKDLIAEMTSPFIKEPLEQIFNYDLFRGKEIQQWKGQKEEFLGISMPKRIAKLAKNLVVLSELNRANPFGILGEATKDEITGDITRTKSYDAIKWNFFGQGNEFDLPGEGLTERVGEGGFDADPGARLLRFLTGVKTYQADAELGKYFVEKGIQDDLTTLLAYLKKAKRQGRSQDVAQLEKLIESFLSGEERSPLLN